MNSNQKNTHGFYGKVMMSSINFFSQGKIIGISFNFIPYVKVEISGEWGAPQSFVGYTESKLREGLRCRYNESKLREGLRVQWNIHVSENFVIY